MNDRSQDVRSTFYEVLFHWMTKIDIHYLKLYEPYFVQFLLNGISDDKLDISPKCIKFLDEHGLRMKDALKALGEFEEEEEEEEPVVASKSQDTEMIQEIKQKNQEASKTEYSNSAMEDID